jgi:type I restriction enzyme S subunit
MDPAMSVPAYPAYKDSGVAWLGEVPAHWGVDRLLDVASYNDEVLADGTPADFEIDYVEISGVSAGCKDLATTTVTFREAPSRARRVVRDGDILISTVRTYLRAIATVGEAPTNLVASTGFAVVRPRSVHAGFLGFAVQAEAFIAEVISKSVGVSYPAINGSDLVRIRIPVPPPTEQAAIAAFLDRETGKIDALVEEQRRLIALLKEKRQAVISHAVTKGLNPQAPLKPSGIDWLGEVPAHWEVKRLKHAGRLLGGSGFPHDDQGVEGEELPFFKVGDLAKAEDGRMMQRGDHSISVGTAKELRASIVPPGSVVYAKIGAALLLNRRRVVIVPCCIDNNMTAFTPREDQVTSAWSWYWLSTLDFGKVVNPGAVPSLSEGDQAELPILVPPMVEQRQIAAMLDTETGKIDALVRTAERGIALLAERRAALISAAVTGKIDVRGLVLEG